MHIPRYWARRVQSAQGPNGLARRIACWGWSDVSLSEAQTRAEDRVAAIALKVRAGQELDRYGYADRPLREEIVDAIRDRAGGEAALITRNQYGAQVLNAARALFIDIDFPETSAGGGLVGAVQQLFGAKPQDPAAPHLERLGAWARRNPFLGLRVYRTAAGLRGVVTNEVFDPARSDALDILRQLGSDPLYVRLCQAQGCFRARLTPKPWRCAVSGPPARFPWDDVGSEARFREWERRYAHASTKYAVCKPVAAFGPREVHPDLIDLLAYHDRFTLATQERPLA
ncbi:MAG: hypothetical protein JNL73_06345 [Anaerolineales bacterium]|nr:hypothetical protein [Anaerolineales bacterium]